MATQLTGRYLPPPTREGLLKAVGGDIVWVGSSEVFPTAEYHADLPSPISNLGEIFYVEKSSGIWLVNRKSRGFYRSNGSVWEYAGELTEAFRSDNFEVYDATNNARSFKFNTGSITASNPIVLSVPNHDLMIGESAEYTAQYNVLCDQDVGVGDWVYLDANQVARKAIATSLTSSLIAGIVLQKPSASIAHIATSGVVSTLFSSLTPQAEYFLSAEVAGEMSLVPPASQGSVVTVVGRALTPTQLLILPQIRVIKS